MKQSAPGRVVLLANGALIAPAYTRSLLAPEDFVIAVNGGTHLARKLNRLPDLLIGDSDSLPAALQRWLAEHEVPRHVHPAAKDETDLELALRHAFTLQPPSILLLGATGRRVDHMLANFSLFALAHEAGVRLEATAGHEHVHGVFDVIELRGETGQTVSLLPWGGDASGVRTEGLRWELRGATLPFGPSRGISNEMTGQRARVSLEAGLLLVSHHRGPLAERVL